jgi:DNA-binding transcriptional LysR family regulator
MANIDSIDLNLLRLFDAVYRTRNVSRAAEELGLSQPATSQALSRLRLLLRDPLFERVAGGVRPTARSERLAHSVQAGLALLEAGLKEDESFDPATTDAELRLHLSDIGEGRFLPPLMTTFREIAPNLRITSRAWPPEAISEALDNGQLHFALGFLPTVSGSAQAEMLTDRYQIFVRAGHPVTRHAVGGALSADAIARLDFVSVRSHAQTQRILEMLHLDPRIRLVVSSFTALPPIIRATDLAVLMPRQIGLGLEPVDAFALLEPALPQRDFSVALHWSRRHAQNAMLRWAREVILGLFRDAQRSEPTSAADG